MGGGAKSERAVAWPPRKQHAFPRGRSEPRFIHIPRARGDDKVPFTEEQLAAVRGGLTAE